MEDPTFDLYAYTETNCSWDKEPVFLVTAEKSALTDTKVYVKYNKKLNKTLGVTFGTGLQRSSKIDSPGNDDIILIEQYDPILQVISQLDPRNRKITREYELEDGLIQNEKRIDWSYIRTVYNGYLTIGLYYPRFMLDYVNCS